MSCSLLNVLLILSQQMPSALFCCCMNLLFFLSPDFKYVRVCVCQFFFLTVVDKLGFVLFPLKVCSEQTQSEFVPEITCGNTATGVPAMLTAVLTNWGRPLTFRLVLT